jgi:SAM-dependent methyltransferase
VRTPYEGCPLCGSDHQPFATIGCDHHPRWSAPLPSVIEWRQCGSCAHVFTDGHFTDEALAHLFAGTNPEQSPGFKVEQHRHLWAPTVAKVASLAPSGRWLDVGFGNGNAMMVAAEFGFDVVGIDTRRSTVDRMRAFGFNAECVALADCAGERFDVVSMFDVLEHMPYPGDELAHVNRLLNDGGLVIVSCPNMDSHAWRAADADHANPYWGEIEHYHNFSRTRLVDLLAERGFAFVSFAVADRFRFGMEIVARKVQDA